MKSQLQHITSISLSKLDIPNAFTLDARTIFTLQELHCISKSLSRSRKE